MKKAAYIGIFGSLWSLWMGACSTSNSNSALVDRESTIADAAAPSSNDSDVSTTLHDANVVDARSAVDAELPKSDASTAGDYNGLIMSDHPVAYWYLDSTTTTEVDRSGNGNTGTYTGRPASVVLPNGDLASNFDGVSQCLTIPSKKTMSVSTTGNLTWEGWIRPAVLNFAKSTGGYVDWMGKCAHYAPDCEWEARMYNEVNAQKRPNRLSAYVFNPSAGYGSAADWQPASNVIHVNQWYHVVGEYTTHSQPPDCPNEPAYPGSISIWVNGIAWNQVKHNPTGCMSQYSVVPKAGGSPVKIGTMAPDSWFQGGIGKVAIYDYLLTEQQIRNHYTRMTGNAPTGTCSDTCSF